MSNNYYKYGSADIRGVNELEKKIVEICSERQAVAVTKKGLEAGADVMVNNLKKNFGSFKDTGTLQQSTVQGKKMGSGRRARTVKVGWDDPGYRYAHLNEFGYTKHGRQITPKGYGVIAKTIEETKSEYFRVACEEMRRILKSKGLI